MLNNFFIILQMIETIEIMLSFQSGHIYLRSEVVKDDMGHLDVIFKNLFNGYDVAERYEEFPFGSLLSFMHKVYFHFPFTVMGSRWNKGPLYYNKFAFCTISIKAYSPMHQKNVSTYSHNNKTVCVHIGTPFRNPDQPGSNAIFCINVLYYNIIIIVFSSPHCLV